MPDTPDPAASNSSGEVVSVGPSPPSPAHSTLRQIFIGADGLRAGWSLLLYAAIGYLLLTGTFFLTAKVLAHIHPNHAVSQAQPGPTGSSSPTLIPPGRTILDEGLTLVVVALATFIMAKIERRPSAVYGLAPDRAVPRFLSGVAAGVILLSVLILILRATGLLVFDSRLLFGAHALDYAAVWALGFLLVGSLEEYLTRGFILFTLARGIRGLCRIFRAPHAEALGFWTAALFTSFIFGFGHNTNPGESPIGLVSAGLIGLVFCLSLWRTGSLWWAIGFHASWDWAQSFLYGVADSGTVIQGHLFATHPVGRPILSGGLTGPEGSIFALPVVALAAVVLLLSTPPRRTSPQDRIDPTVADIDARPEARQAEVHLDLR